jgi:2-aminoadipate transaminase
MTSTTGTLPYARRAAGLVGSVIDSSTSLLAKQRHDIVRFAMGSPAPEAIPTRLLSAFGERELGHASADAYDYAATEGDPRLRAALLTTLAGSTDAIDDDRLFITAGGMQGLDLINKIFTDPGDLVVVESPTYTNGSATALSYGAELLEIGVDGDGMRIDELERRVGSAGRVPKVIYCIPTFQNPSGTTLSLERRRGLLELADRWGSIVIDDDPYGMLRFAGEDLPSLYELADGDPKVIGVRTFSKIIAPGLRVGWLAADPALHPLLINAKQAMDTCTNVPAQRLVAAFLEAGALAEHLRTQREVYRGRKEAMQAALAAELGDRATWTDPDGGFFLWVTLGRDVDTQALFEVALAEGVAYIPGSAFSPSGRFGNALRLCFASTDPDRTREGIARLRRALDIVMNGA